jgi:antitoxin CptB
MSPTENSTTASEAPEHVITHQLDPLKRARLRWRARRGLLENDLILTRYLDANEENMTDSEVEALTRLMEISDNDLMGLLLKRSEPTGEIDTPSIHALIQKIRLA